MIDNIDYDRESPFQPGVSVSPSKFRGRQETIVKILRYVNKAIKGETQHFFLTGNRRMGKTSVAEFVKYYAQVKFDMVGVYVSNKGNNSIEHLTSEIIEAILNELPSQNLLSKIEELFKNHVEIIDLPGVKFKIKTDEITQRSFKENFPDLLKELFAQFPEDKQGLFIVIDDINGLSDSREFADWYKKFADTISVSDYYNLPVYMLLAGYPEKFDALVLHEESFGSIFHRANIGKLTDDEVDNFFTDIFNENNITIDEEALNLMIKFSSGLPLMMQQIGESIFWNINNNSIDIETAYKGIFSAANEISEKQIKPILNILNSEDCNVIMNYLVENNLRKFKREDLIENIEISEKGLDTILSKMEKLDIIELINNDTYSFINELYYIYFLIKFEERKNN